MSGYGIVSRVSPVHTAMRNCTRDEGRPFEVGNQVLISSHRKLLSSKAMVVNVAEKSEAAPTARPKVPMRRRGADCPVVVMKRGNARGAKGAGHRR